MLVGPDEIGTLLISAACKDTEVVQEDLREFASDHFEAGAQPRAAKAGDYVGFEIAYSEGSMFCRQWCLRHGKQALLVTYDCELESRGAEDDSVRLILASLRQAQTPAPQTPPEPTANVVRAQPRAPRFPWALWLLGPVSLCAAFGAHRLGPGVGASLWLCMAPFALLANLAVGLLFCDSLSENRGHLKSAASWLLAAYFLGIGMAIGMRSGDLMLGCALAVMVPMPIVGVLGRQRDRAEQRRLAACSAQPTQPAAAPGQPPGPARPGQPLAAQHATRLPFGATNAYRD